MARPKKDKSKIKVQALKAIDLIVENLPEEPVIDTQTVLEIKDQIEEEQEQEVKNIITEQKEKHKKEWDFEINDEILFFDPNLSYELSGYKPITEEKGLDFNPNWFTETRETFLRTGHYCAYPKKTKAFNDFWKEQYTRCREGLTVNGYTITGDHYFFLNFYQLDILTGTSKAGGGRNRSFPAFFVEQYKYFHYLELCKRLRKNCVLMKARGVNNLPSYIVIYR